MKLDENIMQFLTQLLKPQRLTEIVDIGANPIDGDPPYKVLLDNKLCRLTGFEPQVEALQQLNNLKSDLENYLPYAVGDGQKHILNICRYSGMTSLFKPNMNTLDHFIALKPNAEIIQEVEVETLKLDDIDEIEQLDFLKIDIQGAELSVFQSGRNKLQHAVAIQTEISFITLYENQPSMGDVDVELRAQGFVPHCFAALKKWPIAPFMFEQNPRQPLNQLLEADLVYVRDFTRSDLMESEQLKHLAIIAHYCYQSFDLALRCMMVLQPRGVLSEADIQLYIQHLNQPPQ